MSHDTHHDTHHTHETDTKPTTSFRASFWFVVILAGLFVAAVNFVNVMGHDSGEGHGAATHETGHATHDASPTHEPMEATSNQTLEGETGLGKPVEDAHNNEHHEAEAHEGSH